MKTSRRVCVTDRFVPLPKRQDGVPAPGACERDLTWASDVGIGSLQLGSGYAERGRRVALT